MKYEVLVTKVLLTDNKKTFRIGDDIKFNILNEETNNYDVYIGEIKEITNKSIVISKIEINRKTIKGNMTIILQDIEKNSCNYVSVD